MYRLAIVASHPIQYHTPWYRSLASKLDLHVYYVHQVSPQDQARAGFDVPFEWDLPLLDGYPFTWLENRARHPGVDRFWGCNSPQLKTILQRERFDAVLVNGWNLLYYWQAVAAARKRGLPLFVRGDSQLLSPRSRWRRVAKRMAYPILLRRFSGFLSVGQRNAEYLRNYGVPPKKIFSVPHCVDNEFFRAAAETARKIQGGPRKRFNIAEDKVVFLFVGKFIPKKRPFDFLSTLDWLQRQGANVWGLLIGDGPMRPHLERHVKEHGTPCSFGGFLNQREIGVAYAASDALVLPSDGAETWGLVVNEAMACGVPAIVSDQLGCAPDLIVEGKTGFTYPCGQVDDLSQRMLGVVKDRRLCMDLSKRAAEHIAAFSIEASCAGLLDALDFVLHKDAT